MAKSRRPMPPPTPSSIARTERYELGANIRELLLDNTLNFESSWLMLVTWEGLGCDASSSSEGIPRSSTTALAVESSRHIYANSVA